MDRVTEEILDEVAEEFKLRKSTVRYIYMNFWKHVSDIIREGDIYEYESMWNIYIPGLGKLGIMSKKFIDKIRGYKERTQERKRNV